MCVVCVLFFFFFFFLFFFFLYFLNFVLSRYVARVLFAWLWNGSSRPCYYRQYFCFHIPHALSVCYEVFIFLGFILDHISVSRNCNIYLIYMSLSLLLLIMMSCLLLGLILSVRTCWFHNMITLLSWVFRLILVHGQTSVCCLILLLLTCMC